MNRPLPFFLASTVLLLCPMHAFAGPTLDDILKAYTAHQDEILHFADTFEFQEDVDARYTIPRFQKVKKTTWGMDGDFAYDGKRFLLRFRDWYATPQPDGYGSRQNPGVHMDLWDGQTHWQYAGRTIPLPGKPRGMVIMQPNVAACPKFGPYTFPNPAYHFTIGGYAGHPAMGFLLGKITEDYRRVDEILRAAQGVKVRPDAEPLGNTVCAVVDAELPEGELTIWFDTRRQFNVARAVLLHRPGHASAEWPELKVQQGQMTYRVTDYAEVNGLWVPKEVAWDLNVEYANGDHIRRQCQFRRLSFELDPDFEGRKTFSVADLEEGTDVSEWQCLTDPKTGQHLDRVGPQYVWHNGALVPKPSRQPRNR